MRPAFAALAVTLALLSAGCLSGDPADPPGTTGTETCATAPDACLAPLPLAIELDGCVQARFLAELARETFPLPDGLSNNASLTSPQRVAGALTTCAAAAVDGVAAGPASYGFTAVLVEPARGLEANGHAFDLEVLTDNPRVADAFRARGIPVAAAAVAIADAGPVRTATARGDVAYDLRAYQVPDEDSLAVTASLAHLLPESQYVETRTCTYYTGLAATRLEAADGALAPAMPPAGGLAGQSSQATACGVRLAFA